MRFLFILILIPIHAFSQDVYDEDSLLTELVIVDTNFYNGEEIYVFNDQSWEYADEFNVVERVKTNIVEGCLTFDKAQLYSKNWKNHKTFSIVHNLSGATDSVMLDVSGAIKPVNYACNSEFKIRWGRWHQGHDYACKVGTPIKAMWGGKVRYAKMNHGGFGKLVIIRHPNGLETYYAHMNEFNVSVDDFVEPGQVIGWVGTTGHSSGPHLHLEVRFMDNPIDPATVFDSKTLLVHSGVFRSMKKTSKEVSLRELFGVNMATEKSVEQVLQKKRTRRRRTSSNMD